MSQINAQNDTQKKHSCSAICPDVEFLNKAEILTDVVCPVPNCDNVFSQVSALNLHLEKAHRLNQKVNRMLFSLKIK
jgi:hypothetical protein